MSKRAVLGIISAAVMMFVGMAPSLRADPGPDIICQEIDAGLSSLFGRTVTIDHDTCVACETVLVKDSHAGQVCLCKAFQDAGLFPEAGLKNLGECVSSIAQNGIPTGPTNLSVATLSLLLFGWGAIRFFRRRSIASA